MISFTVKENPIFMRTKKILFISCFALLTLSTQSVSAGDSSGKVSLANTQTSSSSSGGTLTCGIDTKSSTEDKTVVRCGDNSGNTFTVVATSQRTSVANNSNDSILSTPPRNPSR